MDLNDGGGGAPAAAAAAIRQQRALLVGGFGRVLVLGRGWILCDTIAIAMAFLLSLIPSFDPGMEFRGLEPPPV